MNGSRRLGTLTMEPLSGGGGHEGCVLFPGFFGIAVQGLLFFAVCVSLVFKKSREKSERSWFEFLLDSSKQLVGAGLIHVLNIAFAVWLDAHMADGDACSWYWVNIVVDCTLGTFICYLLLQAFTRVLIPRALGERASVDFKTGDYGDTFSSTFDYGKYGKQIALWCLIVTCMKFIMLLVMVVCAYPLHKVADFVLLPFAAMPQLKLVVVMILTPFIMNTFQFWVTDNFIKKQPDGDEDGLGRPLPVQMSDNPSLDR